MKVIGLTGKNAAGKGEVANYLVKNGFSYFSLSDIIREVATSRNLENSRENMITIGNELREKGGPGILAKLTREKLINNSVIDSIRNPMEVEELRKLDDFTLIAIDCPIEIRFERAINRGRVENAKTLEEFKAIEERENSTNPNAQQLNETIKLADVIIINDKDLESFHKKIEKVVEF